MFLGVKELSTDDGLSEPSRKIWSSLFSPLLKYLIRRPILKFRILRSRASEEELSRKDILLQTFLNYLWGLLPTPAPNPL